MHGGRRLLLGWMGMPDADYTNPTLEYGYQHCMSVFRELDFKDNTLYMKPVKELESIRKPVFEYAEERVIYKNEDDKKAFELEISNFGENLKIEIFDTVKLDFDTDRGDLELSFIANGYGRDKRYLKIKSLESLRIMIDSSSLEIFVNDGKYVMSARMYPSNYSDIKVSGNIRGKLYSLDI